MIIDLILDRKYDVENNDYNFQALDYWKEVKEYIDCGDVDDDNVVDNIISLLKYGKCDDDFMTLENVEDIGVSWLVDYIIDGDYNLSIIDFIRKNKWTENDVDEDDNEISGDIIAITNWIIKNKDEIISENLSTKKDLNDIYDNLIEKIRVNPNQRVRLFIHPMDNQLSLVD